MRIKICVVVLLLFTATIIPNAQTVEKCLAVYPTAGNEAQAALSGVATAGIGLLAMHGERFWYLESTGLPLASVKTHYSKRELAKLEKNGVKVVVTTKEAVTAREKHSDQAHNDSSSGQSSATVQASAGCIKTEP